MLQCTIPRSAKMVFAKRAIPPLNGNVNARMMRYLVPQASSRQIPLIQPNSLTAYLTADTDHTLIDQPIHIGIQNLLPGQRITLRTLCVNSHGGNRGLFQAVAHFEAGLDGRIDTSTSPSLGGTYQGIEPMGQFWSMVPVSNDFNKGKNPKTRILTTNPLVPLRIRLDVYPGFHDFNSETLDAVERCLVGQELDSMFLSRGYLAEDVTVETVNHDSPRGSLYVPQCDGKLKGILDLGGIGAGHQPARAALLASHGFVVFACHYDSKNVHIEDLEEAVEWLLKHPKVDQSGIGILASSAGSPIGLTLASDSRVKEKIRAIACVNAIDCPVAFPIHRNGQPSNFFPFITENMRFTDEGYGMTRPCFDFNKEEQEDSRVPVENMHAKLLLLAGQDDKSVPADVMARKIKATMVKHCKGDQCDSVIYRGAGHLIEPPYKPLCRSSYVKIFKEECAWGGEPKLHARAEEDAWKRIREFFRKLL